VEGEGSVSGGPLVTIAVNNYNYQRFLGEAIDSALGQSYPRVEVIVVDDGSTDGSREIIAGYGDRVIPILKENGGQASAFNAGFAASKGEIVIFLDADDVLLPETVARVVEAWRPGISKVQYLLEVMDAEGRRQGRLWLPNAVLSSGDLRELILSSGTYLSPPTSGNAFARDVLARLLPMPEKEWRISADGYLVSLAPFLGEVLSLNERIGLYRVHDSNHWTREGMDLRRIRAYIAHDLQRQDLLAEFADREGIAVEKNLVLRVPSHVKYRLASLLADPEGHPYPEDSRWSLARHGIAGCFRAGEFTWRKKALYSAWFALLAFSPGSARSLINLGLTPANRPRVAELVDAARRGGRQRLMVGNRSENGATRPERTRRVSSPVPGPEA
jgi:glycosyltransferase involved in cell wall biosynthesis